MSMVFHHIDRIEADVSAYDWHDAEVVHRADIHRYWDDFARGQSGVFNGTVLLQHRSRIEGGVFHATYFATEYRNMLGYMRLGFVTPGVRNGFGMAALRARDGAFLLGQMGMHTANPGKIYFAAGTPDREDIIDGKVDLASSVVREMCEETGLTLADVTVRACWTCLVMPKRVAFMRPVTIDLPATEARALMLERMRATGDDELSDIVIVRPGDATDNPMMPDFMQAYLARAFAGDCA